MTRQEELELELSSEVTSFARREYIKKLLFALHYRQQDNLKSIEDCIKAVRKVWNGG